MNLLRTDGRTLLSLNRAMAAFAMVLVMALGVWQCVVAINQIARSDYPNTITDFREGRTTAAWEKLIDQKMPVRSTLISIANSIRYLITGGGGEQVRIGKGGWLFLTDEIRFDPEGQANLAVRADLLGAASRDLKRMGVSLVVALVPDKARVHASYLRNSRYPQYNQTRYSDALSAIRARDVTVVDLLEPLAAGASASEVYYRTDTHWNQTGAKLAATAVAAVVRQLGVDLNPAQYDALESTQAVLRPGDLLRLMGLETAPDALRPAADLEVPIVTQERASNHAGGLFGDAGVSVVLTGTSYSLRGNFHGFLQQALNTRILNAAKDGGGFLQATGAYLTDESFRSAKPVVLVWELPERFVLSAIDAEPGWLEKTGLKR